MNDASAPGARAGRDFASADPVITVLMPVRNGMPWLPAALDSLLGQTFTNFEIVVLEDGSTDDTPQFLSSICDPRVRILPTGGVGIARALNVGIDAARGRYMARHDADDESVPDRLDRQLAVLESHPDVDLVASVADYIDADGNEVSSPWVETVRRQQDVAVTPDEIRALMPVTCCITHGSVMIRSDVLRAHRYDAETVPAEDYDLWLRLLPRHGFAKLSARLYRHRLHGRQSGALRRDDQTRQAILAKLRYIRRVCPELPAVASLAVAGAARGDQFYRAVAPDAGFRIVNADAWDVFAVTDFASIDAQYRQLKIAGDIVRIGNCFIRRGRRAHRRRGMLRGREATRTA